MFWNKKEVKPVERMTSEEFDNVMKRIVNAHADMRLLENRIIRLEAIQRGKKPKEPEEEEQKDLNTRISPFM